MTGPLVWYPSETGAQGPRSNEASKRDDFRHPIINSLCCARPGWALDNPGHACEASQTDMVDGEREGMVCER